MLAIIS